MLEFEIIDHTADVGIIAYGNTVEQVFMNAATGMFSLIGDISKVSDELEQEIEVEADDQSELLVAWLNELLYLFDAENLIFSKFEIDKLTKTRLKATAYGEQFDTEKHGLKTQIKAATYHQLQLKQTEEGYKAQVILDV